MMMAVETGEMYLQAKEHQRLLATTRGSEGGMGQTLPKSLQKETTLLTPQIWTSSPRIVRETVLLFQTTHSVVICHDHFWKLICTT